MTGVHGRAYAAMLTMCSRLFKLSFTTMRLPSISMTCTRLPGST